MRQNDIKYSLRLYLEQDSDLIEWLNSLSDGEKSRIVKNALRLGIGLEKSAPQQPALDVTALLPELRQIVETAVRTALADLQLSPSKPSNPGGEDSAAGEILADLEASLLVDSA